MPLDRYTSMLLTCSLRTTWVFCQSIVITLTLVLVPVRLCLWEIHAAAKIKAVALTLLAECQEKHMACQNRVRFGVVICLERCVDRLHMVQLMPLHPKTPAVTFISFKSRLVYLSGTSLPRLSWKRGMGDIGNETLQVGTEWQQL